MQRRHIPVCILFTINSRIWIFTVGLLGVIAHRGFLAPRPPSSSLRSNSNSGHFCIDS